MPVTDELLVGAYIIGIQPFIDFDLGFGRLRTFMHLQEIPEAVIFVEASQRKSLQMPGRYAWMLQRPCSFKNGQASALSVILRLGRINPSTTFSSICWDKSASNGTPSPVVRR